MDRCGLFLLAFPKRSLAQSGSFSVELLHSTESHFAWANQRSVSRRVPLCLQGCDSSMWVRAAPGATSPQGPLQDGYNSSPRADAIAGIPTRNRDAFAQGTDTLAAAPQSIHQSLKGVATAKGHSSHPHGSPLEGTGPPGLTPRRTPRWRSEMSRLCRNRGSHFSWPDNRGTLLRMWKIITNSLFVR